MQFIGILITLFLISCTPPESTIKRENPESSLGQNSTKPQVGTLKQKTGVVQFHRAGNDDWTKILPGFLFSEEDEVRVVEQSSAQVKLLTGVDIELSESSELVFLSKRTDGLSSHLGLRGGAVKVFSSVDDSGQGMALIKTAFGWVEPTTDSKSYQVEVSILDHFFTVKATSGNLKLLWNDREKKLSQGQIFKKRIRRSGLTAQFNQPPQFPPEVKEVTKFDVIDPPAKSTTKKKHITIVAEVMDGQSVYLKGEKLIVRDNRVEFETYLTPGLNTFIFNTIHGGKKENFRYEIERIQDL